MLKNNNDHIYFSTKHNDNIIMTTNSSERLRNEDVIKVSHTLYVPEMFLLLNKDQKLFLRKVPRTFESNRCVAELKQANYMHLKINRQHNISMLFLVSNT